MSTAWQPRDHILVGQLWRFIDAFVSPSRPPPGFPQAQLVARARVVRANGRLAGSVKSQRAVHGLHTLAGYPPLHVTITIFINVEQVAMRASDALGLDPDLTMRGLIERRVTHLHGRDGTLHLLGPDESSIVRQHPWGQPALDEAEIHALVDSPSPRTESSSPTLHLHHRTPPTPPTPTPSAGS